MPVVQIYMYSGRSKEQKKELVERISRDFERSSGLSRNLSTFCFTIWTKRTGGFAAHWPPNRR